MSSIWNKIKSFALLNQSLAFPYGSGFPLQSFLKQKRIFASIPNATHLMPSGNLLHFTSLRSVP